MNVKVVKLATTVSLAASTYAILSNYCNINCKCNNTALSIDSVAVSTSDRVLIKDQTDAAQKYLYNNEYLISKIVLYWTRTTDVIQMLN